ncbi:MAG: hypothetical protein RBQ94_05500 [Methanimicrococcus sp.]|nr:hypothetical protein [Methanimicrococcus sp.]
MQQQLQTKNAATIDKLESKCRRQLKMQMRAAIKKQKAIFF